MIVFTKDSTDVIEEYPNSEDDEDVEDIQEAVGRLYVEMIELSKANSKLKKENNELKEKS